jgi:tRNA A37 threonylcarbamoyladenosine modification protein TsaB
VDAGRREVFALVGGEPKVLAPAELEPGLLVGDGALRYRSVFEELGATIPPDDDARHVPRARHHAALASDFGPADAVEPLYLRVPDAERSA